MVTTIPTESALKFFKMQLHFVTDILKYWNSATFSKDYEYVSGIFQGVKGG
jgi:hypothetical protein